MMTERIRKKRQNVSDRGKEKKGGELQAPRQGEKENGEQLVGLFKKWGRTKKETPLK